VVHAAEQLAALWGTTPEEVGQLTTATARRIYRLPAT
jgi:Tat protein secretion system quality control protein TatD with DNase activity